jgi:antitoxin component of RelBE/YafQ-DinJ toxin-antitoxin module
MDIGIGAGGMLSNMGLPPGTAASILLNNISNLNRNTAPFDPNNPQAWMVEAAKLQQAGDQNGALKYSLMGQKMMEQARNQKLATQERLDTKWAAANAEMDQLAMREKQKLLVEKVAQAIEKKFGKEAADIFRADPTEAGRKEALKAAMRPEKAAGGEKSYAPSELEKMERYAASLPPGEQKDRVMRALNLKYEKGRSNPNTDAKNDIIQTDKMLAHIAKNSNQKRLAAAESGLTLLNETGAKGLSGKTALINAALRDVFPTSSRSVAEMHAIAKSRSLGRRAEDLVTQWLGGTETFDSIDDYKTIFNVVKAAEQKRLEDAVSDIDTLYPTVRDELRGGIKAKYKKTEQAAHPSGGSPEEVQQAEAMGYHWTDEGWVK